MLHKFLGSPLHIDRRPLLSFCNQLWQLLLVNPSAQVVVFSMVSISTGSSANLFQQPTLITHEIEAFPDIWNRGDSKTGGIKPQTHNAMHVEAVSHISFFANKKKIRKNCAHPPFAFHKIWVINYNGVAYNNANTGYFEEFSRRHGEETNCGWISLQIIFSLFF